jgi:hypothetical protein
MLVGEPRLQYRSSDEMLRWAVRQHGYQEDKDGIRSASGFYWLLCRFRHKYGVDVGEESAEDSVWIFCN